MTTQKRHTFAIGDLVHRIIPINQQPTTEIYVIVSIHEEPGGSFHDGFSISTIATLVDVKTRETFSDVCIRYNNFMCNILHDFVVLATPEGSLNT
jgi:hypothetical protein